MERGRPVRGERHVGQRGSGMSGLLHPAGGVLAGRRGLSYGRSLWVKRCFILVLFSGPAGGDYPSDQPGINCKDYILRVLRGGLPPCHPII